jgi:hypothetical protein
MLYPTITQYLMIRMIKCYVEISTLLSKVEESGFKDFNVLITLNYLSPLNYFDNRSTNASAESLMQKLKVRSQFRDLKNHFYGSDYLIF